MIIHLGCHDNEAIDERARSGLEQRLPANTVKFFSHYSGLKRSISGGGTGSRSGEGLPAEWT